MFLRKYFDADGGSAGGPGAGDPPPEDGGAAGDPPADGNEATFEKWLEAQPENVRKLYETHTGGLKSTLDKLRAGEKEAAGKLKRLADLEAAETKCKQERMSEAERVAAEKQTLEAELAKLRTTAKEQSIRHAVELTASRMRFRNIEDARALADLSTVEIAEDGKVSGVEDALKALAKARPYLVQTDNESQDIDARNKKQQPDILDEARKAELAQRFGVSFAATDKPNK